MFNNTISNDEPCFVFPKLMELNDPELHYRALDLAYIHAQNTIPACAKHHKKAIDYFYLLVTTPEIDECYESYYEYVSTMLMYYVYRGQQLAVDYFYGAETIDLENLCGQIDQEFMERLQSKRAEILRLAARADVVRAGALTNLQLDREYRRYYTRARLYARHLCVLAGFEQLYMVLCSSFVDAKPGSYVQTIRKTLSVPPRGCRDSDTAQQLYTLLSLSRRGRPGALSKGENANGG